jgi:hypothetical protein
VNWKRPQIRTRPLANKEQVGRDSQLGGIPTAKFLADASALLVWPKNPNPLAEVAPTNELWRQIRDGQGRPPALTVTVELAKQYRFFHWQLQFPRVFVTGGFDVVLGNPPWER